MKTKNKKITKIFKNVKIEIDKGYPGPACTYLNNMIKKGEDRPLTKDEITWLRPNKNFDNNHFWKTIHETFGTQAITNIKGLSIKDANKATLRMSKDFKLLERVKKKLNKDIKILEIGSGYGNFHNWLEENNFNMDNYYSIEVYPYFYHDNLYITDGNTFPEKLPKFDIVYSCNVFQHLIQKQRNMYYENIYKHLTFNGVFYGSNFFTHPKTKNMKIDNNGKEVDLWGMKDEDGNDYLTFFGQYTEVENAIEWVDKMNDIGFIPKLIANFRNFYSFEAIKKWTII